MAQSESSIQLTPIDGMLLPVYVRLILGFRLSDTWKPDSITKTLRKALSLTAAEYPALGGIVVEREGAKKGRLEVRNIGEVDLVVKHIPDFASYEELDAKRMPTRLLTGTVLCPTGPMTGKNSKAARAQVNYIKGGILLCLSLHHRVFDGVGGANVMTVWSSFCRMLSSDPASLPSGRITSWSVSDTERLMNKEPILERREHPGLLIPSETADPSAFAMASVQMVVKTFRMTQDAQRRLKSLLVDESPQGSTISTNDSINALVWATVSAARRTHLEPDITSEKTSKLGLAINGRSRMTPPLTQEYPYNVGLYGVVGQPLSRLYSGSPQDLAHLALAIREEVNKVDDAYIRSYVAFLDDLPNLSVVQPSWNAFLGKDYTITSWAANGLYELDWGRELGGKADYVRIPAGPFDGVCIILPRRADGSLELIIGLREDDMGRVIENERFMEYAEIFAE